MAQYQGEQTVSMGEWFVTGLLMCIPVVNIVMIFVWAFSSNTKPSKANFFRLYLILAVIGIAISIALYFMGVLTMDLWSDLDYTSFLN